MSFLWDTLDVGKEKDILKDIDLW